MDSAGNQGIRDGGDSDKQPAILKLRMAVKRSEKRREGNPSRGALPFQFVPIAGRRGWVPYE